MCISHFVTINVRMEGRYLYKLIPKIGKRCFSDTYEQAHRRAKRAVDTSNVESCEDSPVRKKKRPSRFEPMETVSGVESDNGDGEYPYFHSQ